MSLTVAGIRATRSNAALLDKLLAELEWRLPGELHQDLGAFVPALYGLTPGLRAMAATYQLDVSMALDDLGWHFKNWHHRGYCDETSTGLWLLEANEVAQIFDRAYQLVSPYWDDIDSEAFADWYFESPLEKALGPLNGRLWEICEHSPQFRLFQFWLDFARKYPERVVQ